MRRANTSPSALLIFRISARTRRTRGRCARRRLRPSRRPSCNDAVVRLLSKVYIHSINHSLRNHSRVHALVHPRSLAAAHGTLIRSTCRELRHSFALLPQPRELLQRSRCLTPRRQCRPRGFRETANKKAAKVRLVLRRASSAAGLAEIDPAGDWSIESMPLPKLGTEHVRSGAAFEKDLAPHEAWIRVMSDAFLPCLLEQAHSTRWCRLHERRCIARS